MNKTKISPTVLGKLIGSLKIPLNEKEEILNHIQYMNAEEIQLIYNKLIDYKVLEENAISKLETLELEHFKKAEQVIKQEMLKQRTEK